MRSLKGIFLSLLAVSPIAVSLSVVSMNSVNAQAADQTLAQCVKDLNDAYPYRVNSTLFAKHTQNCLNNLATQKPIESLGQCVKDLNDAYPYRVNPNLMEFSVKACNDLLIAQRSNSHEGRNHDSHHHHSDHNSSGIYGAWAVKMGDWNGILRMRGNDGNMVLVYKTGAAVEQLMTLKANPEGGYILNGEVLTIYTNDGKYDADKFYFETFYQKDSFSVKNCDGVHECFSVTLVYLGK